MHRVLNHADRRVNRAYGTDRSGVVHIDPLARLPRDTHQFYGHYQVAQPSLTLNQGTLYPALLRLEQKGEVLQRHQSGRGGLEKQTERWRRLAGLVDRLLLNEG